MDVYRTPAAALASLVARRLQPSAEFQRAAWRALGALATTLRERGDRAAAQPWRVLKTAKGGSAGRGTALRGGCDSEIVIFLDCFKSYKDHSVDRAEILKDLWDLLQSWWQKPIPGLNFETLWQDRPGVLQFRLASTDLENWMDVSLVPAFDALGEGSLAPSRLGGKIIRSKTGLAVRTLPQPSMWPGRPSLGSSFLTKHTENGPRRPSSSWIRSPGVQVLGPRSSNWGDFPSVTA